MNLWPMVFFSPLKRLHRSSSKHSKYFCIKLFIQLFHPPFFSYSIHPHNIVCLSYGNLCGVWRKSHTFDHITFFAILVKQNLLSFKNQIFIKIVYITLTSHGLVLNLSFISPNSSNNSTTLSKVHTASFLFVCDHAIAQILAAPSCHRSTSPLSIIF